MAIGDGKEKTSYKIKRPPVVVVLGHVDHGKTTLLDAIRKSDVAAREHGGITQHIGAYQISHQGKKITFIDTPGHELFEKMRAHGASFADIALLVVAADEGVKKQTLEATYHIKKAGIPMIVVITKIDIARDNVEKVKRELFDNDILIEEHGGKIVCLSLSAKTGEGIKDLLDMILIVAEMEELEADLEEPPEAVVLESFLDRKMGSIASVIVKNGLLKIGQSVVVDSDSGKIRALTDEYGRQPTEASPSTPVRILGLSKPPPVGSILKGGALEENEKQEFFFQPTLTPTSVLRQREEQKEKPKVIIKADVVGSLGTILAHIPSNIHVVASAVGDINENDLLQAKTSRAPIFGFNVRVEKHAKRELEREKVDVKIFRLIYELLDELAKMGQRFKEEQEKKKVLGRAKIIASFDLEGGKIAGCKVIDGYIEVGAPVQILRGEKPIGQAKVVSLKRFRKELTKAGSGTECGVALQPQLDFELNDIIEFVTL
jgi:translation initiation factor IF-2